MKKALFSRERVVNPMLTLFSILFFFFCFSWQKAEAQTPKIPQIPLCINELSPWSFVDPANPDVHYEWWTVDPDWAFFGLTDSMGTDTMHFISVYEKLSNPFAINQKEDIVVFVREAGSTTPAQQFTLEKGQQNGWCIISGKDQVCPGEKKVRYDIDRGILTVPSLSITYNWTNSGQGQSYSVGFAENSQDDYFYFTAVAECVKGVYDVVLQLNFGSSSNPEPYFSPAVCPSFCSYAINVSDTNPPVIVHPDDITWECFDAGKFEELVAEWEAEIATPNGSIYSVDDCLPTGPDRHITVTTAVPDPDVIANNSTFTAKVYFTATDHCENIGIDSTVFYINMTAAPKPVVEVADSTLYFECMPVGGFNPIPNFTVVDTCGRELDYVLTSDTTYNNCSYNADLEYIERINFYFTYTALNAEEWVWKKTYISKTHVNLPVAEVRDTVPCRADLENEYTKLPIVKELCFDQEITPAQITNRLYQGTTPAGVDTIVESRFEYVDCAGNKDTLSYLRYVILPDVINNAPDTVKITLACIADTTANYKIAHIIDTLTANYTVTDYCDTELEPEWVSSEDKTEGCIGTFEHKFKYENHNGYSVHTVFQITLNPYQFTIGKERTFTTVVHCADNVKGHTAAEAKAWLDRSEICLDEVDVAVSGPVGVASTAYDTVLQYMYVFSVECTNQKDTVWENVSLDRGLVITLNTNGTIACPKDSAWTNAGFAMTINEMDCIGEFEVDSVITVRNSGNCPAFVDYSFTVTNNSDYRNFLYNEDKVRSITVTYVDTVKHNPFTLEKDTLNLSKRCPSEITEESLLDTVSTYFVVGCAGDTIKPALIGDVKPDDCATSYTVRYAYAHPCYPNKDTLTVIIPITEPSYTPPATYHDTVYCFSAIENKKMKPSTTETDDCGRQVSFPPTDPDPNHIPVSEAQRAAGIDTIVRFAWNSYVCGKYQGSLVQLVYLMRPLETPADSSDIVACVSESEAPTADYMDALILAVDSCGEFKYTLEETMYYVNGEEVPSYDRDDCVDYVKYIYTLTDTNFSEKSVTWNYVDTIKRDPFTTVPDTLKFFPTCLSELTTRHNNLTDTLEKLAYRDACGDSLNFEVLGKDFQENELSDNECTGYLNVKAAYNDCSNNKDTLVIHFRMDYKPLHIHDSLNRTFTVDCFDDATLTNAYILHRNKDAANMVDACGQSLDSVGAYTGTSTLNACGEGIAPFYFIYEDCAGHRDTVTITLTKREPRIYSDRSTIIDYILCDAQDTTTFTYRQVVDTFHVEFSYGCHLDTILVSVDETTEGSILTRVYTLTQGCADTVKLTQVLIFIESPAAIFTPKHYCGGTAAGDIVLTMNPNNGNYGDSRLFVSMKDNPQGEYSTAIAGNYFNFTYNNLSDGTYYIKYHDINHPECLFYDTVTILNLENVEVELPQGGNPCTQMNVIPLTTVELEAKQISSPFDVTAYYEIIATRRVYINVDSYMDLDITLYSDSILIPGTTAPDTTIKWELDMTANQSLIDNYNAIYSGITYYYDYRLILTGAQIKDIDGGCTLSPNDSVICLIPTCPEDQGHGSDYFTLICPNDTIVEIPWSLCEYTYCFEDDMGIPTYSSYVDKVVDGLNDGDTSFVYFRTIEEIEAEISSFDAFEYYYNYYTQEEPMITTFAPGEHTVYVYGYFYVKGCVFFDKCEYKIFVTFKPCGDNDHYISGIDENREAIYGLPYPTYAIDFEQNMYPTVLIDCDCWTAENLRSMFYQDGATVDTFYEYYTDVNLNLDHELPNPEKWGLLYNWNTASRNQITDDFGRTIGICPEGWYLPTLANYTTLVKYGAFALSTETEWLGVDNTTNTTGFAALPAGYYNELARSFYYLLGDAYFWTANRYGLEMAWIAHIHFDCNDLLLEGFEQHRGASVRCIKNEPDPCNDVPAIVDWPAKIELECETVEFAIEIQANAKRRQNALLKVELDPVTTADDILMQRVNADDEWEEILFDEEGVAYINERDMAYVGLSDMIENYRIRIDADILESYNATMSWSIVDRYDTEEVWTMVKTTELTISEISVSTVDFEFAVDTPFTFGCDSFPFKAIINLGNCNETDEFYIDFGDAVQDLELYYTFDTTSWPVTPFDYETTIPVADEDTVYFYLKNINVPPGHIEWLSYHLINGTSGSFEDILIFETTPGDEVTLTVSFDEEEPGEGPEFFVLNFEYDTLYVHVDAACYDGLGLVSITLEPNLADYFSLEYPVYDNPTTWNPIVFDEEGHAWFDRGFGAPFTVANTVVPIRLAQTKCSPEESADIIFQMFADDSTTAISNEDQFIIGLIEEGEIEMTLSTDPQDPNAPVADVISFGFELDTFYVHVDTIGCVQGKGLIRIDIDTLTARNSKIEYKNNLGDWIKIDFIGDSLAWFNGGVADGFIIEDIVVPVRISRTTCLAVPEREISFVMVNVEDSTEISGKIQRTTVLPGEDNVTLSLKDEEYNMLNDVLYLNLAPQTLYAIVEINCEYDGNGLIKIKGDKNFTPYMALEYLQFDQTWTSIHFDGDTLAWFDGGVDYGFPIVNDTVTLRIRQVECVPEEYIIPDALEFPFSFVMVDALDSTTILSNIFEQSVAGNEIDNDASSCLFIHNDLEDICGLEEFTVSISFGKQDGSHVLDGKNIKGEILIILDQTQIAYKDSLTLLFLNKFESPNRWEELQFDIHGVAKFNGGVSGGFPLNKNQSVPVSLQATAINTKFVDLNYTLQIVDASNYDVVYANSDYSIKIGKYITPSLGISEMPTILEQTTVPTEFNIGIEVEGCIQNTQSFVMIKFGAPTYVALEYKNAFDPNVDPFWVPITFNLADSTYKFNGGVAAGFPLMNLSTKFRALSKAKVDTSNVNYSMWIVSANDQTIGLGDTINGTIDLEYNWYGAKTTNKYNGDITVPRQAIEFELTVDTLDFNPAEAAKLRFTILNYNEDGVNWADSLVFTWFDSISDPGNKTWKPLTFNDNVLEFPLDIFELYNVKSKASFGMSIMANVANNQRVQIFIEVLADDDDDVLSHPEGDTITLILQRVEIPCEDCMEQLTGFVTDNDGFTTYKTVKMPDGRWWMAQNLKTAVYPDGSPINNEIVSNAPGYVKPSQNTSGGTQVSMFSDLVYNQYYYNWAAAMGIKGTETAKGYYDTVTYNPRGICPLGWRIPTGQEVANLRNAVRAANPQYMEAGCEGALWACPNSFWHYTTNSHILDTLNKANEMGLELNPYCFSMQSTIKETNSGYSGDFLMIWFDQNNKNIVAFNLLNGNNYNNRVAGKFSSLSGNFSSRLSVRCVKDTDPIGAVIKLYDKDKQLADDFPAGTYDTLNFYATIDSVEYRPTESAAVKITVTNADDIDFDNFKIRYYTTLDPEGWVDLEFKKGVAIFTGGVDGGFPIRPYTDRADTVHFQAIGLTSTLTTVEFKMDVVEFVNQDNLFSKPKFDPYTVNLKKKTPLSVFINVNMQTTPSNIYIDELTITGSIPVNKKAFVRILIDADDCGDGNQCQFFPCTLYTIPHSGYISPEQYPDYGDCTNPIRNFKNDQKGFTFDEIQGHFQTIKFETGFEATPGNPNAPTWPTRPTAKFSIEIIDAEDNTIIYGKYPSVADSDWIHTFNYYND